MRSPFPGMDPYLERYWRDVHGTLIVHARAMLTRQLGAGLRARIDERLVIEVPLSDERWIRPDVYLVERGLHGSREHPVLPTAGVSLAEPLVVEFSQEPAHERYIEIIDPAGGRVITVIEFLSPTNKLPGEGREKYLQKQRDVRDAGIHLVEIDLTRTGERELACPRAHLREAAQAAYLACVSRGFRTQRFELYPISLRERLPVFRIPLRPTDPDAVLDLQALVDTAYEEGAHDDIDYSQPCVPPLEGDDAAWADQLLRAAGKR